MKLVMLGTPKSKTTNHSMPRKLDPNQATKGRTTQPPPNRKDNIITKPASLENPWSTWAIEANCHKKWQQCQRYTP
jgi:hypothetical protein